MKNNQYEEKKDFLSLNPSFNIKERINQCGLLTQIFSYAPVGLMVIDSDRKLYKTNQFIFDYFHQDAIVEDIRFGNCFGCVNAQGEGWICGEQEGCKNCVLRQSLVAVLENDEIIPYTEFSSVFKVKDEWKRKFFTASVVPIHAKEEKYALVTMVDITEQKELEEKLKNQVITDTLTGVFNRRYMVEYLEKVLSREDDLVNIVILDIDNFKKVNDNYGHLVGDEVLKHLSRIMKKVIGKDGIVARYGGEEFVIISQGISQDIALEKLEEIRQQLINDLVPEYGQPVRYSGGLVYLQVQGNKKYNSDELLKTCDDLLYKAKQNGKDQVRSRILED